mgnify:CR=1 FL=1
MLMRLRNTRHIVSFHTSGDGGATWKRFDRGMEVSGYHHNVRGGFLMCDDFHGTHEWEVFMASMSRVFPDRPVVEIDNADAIFHVLYDLDERFQVPGIQYLYTGRTYEKDGVEARWRGIYDDKNRIMVAICFNQDLGDAWEWADSPRYPEKLASLAYRVGINYIIYAMTH